MHSSLPAICYASHIHSRLNGGLGESLIKEKPGRKTDLNLALFYEFLKCKTFTRVMTIADWRNFG